MQARGLNVKEQAHVAYPTFLFKTIVSVWLI